MLKMQIKSYLKLVINNNNCCSYMHIIYKIKLIKNNK